MRKYAKPANRTEVTATESLGYSNAFVKAEAEMYMDIPNGDLYTKLVIVQASTIADGTYIPATDIVIHDLEDIKKLSITIHQFILMVEQKLEFIKESHKKDKGA